MINHIANLRNKTADANKSIAKAQTAIRNFNPNVGDAQDNQFYTARRRNSIDHHTLENRNRANEIAHHEHAWAPYMPAEPLSHLYLHDDDGQFAQIVQTQRNTEGHRAYQRHRDWQYEMQAKANDGHF